jgi:anaerobic nitric oxide reductase transcription regulator
VYPLVVPPLRERGRDVVALAGGFLEENQHRLGARNLRLSPASKAALLAHGWPGNVRELEHVISRASLRAVTEQGRGARWTAIEPHHLALDAAVAGSHATGSAQTPLAQAPTDGGHASFALAAGGTLREATTAFQRAWLADALARHNGHVANAAREAGIDRSNFHRMLRKLGMRPASAD